MFFTRGIEHMRISHELRTEPCVDGSLLPGLNLVVDQVAGEVLRRRRQRTPLRATSRGLKQPFALLDGVLSYLELKRADSPAVDPRPRRPVPLCHLALLRCLVPVQLATHEEGARPPLAVTPRTVGASKLTPRTGDE